MNIQPTYPPNWSEIQQLNPPKDAVFCYGDTIYNPSNGEIPEDVQFHESVHSERQGTDPHSWWQKYILDGNFRLEEELWAFGAQYAFVKRHYPSKAHKSALFEMANNLVENYNLTISYPQAENLIRLYSKRVLL